MQTEIETETKIETTTGTGTGTGADIDITLNGDRRAVARGTDVAALLAGLGLDTRKVAVERNAAIVPRSLYAQTRLLAGDSLEIVHFIGGG